MSGAVAPPLAAGLDAVVGRYDAYGPLAAAFLANLLATFGDKGQLVVVTLASRYDAKTVFVGAMGAFSLWSLLEVLLGQWIVRTLPAGAMTAITGGMFLAFGVWTLRSALRGFQAHAGGEGPLLTGGGIDVGISGKLLPAGVLERVGEYDGLLASFLFILFAEFGDKTQALTITLAGTFPDAPLSVFVGVVAALALRTGVDAVVGERFERLVPTHWVEVAAGVVFLAFGLVVFGLVPPVVLWVVLAAVVAGALALGLRTRRS